ncbi:MAG: hypothetical protein MUO82_06990 [Candidatus Thermoplasmatota archaeon]|nr:hypothetical protein [Candidatus Thermoplasmatota archaeon]
MNKIRYLKENNLILYSPLVGRYMLEKMTVIKDFDFAPISNKILSNNTIYIIIFYNKYGENIQKILILK